ncbi:hypothetical protein EI969_02265 [Pseudomonas sp. PB101]|uniref:hypothetical protein n=1 Tax=Pseudomonas sp. PB101 TaxID=2495428 RepID=UPI00136547A7|nr:hypothetical protein [Pseudomonas sp. PB101]MVW84784.1 hypothetical protein [Pseudomonas sp. PB101]
MQTQLDVLQAIQEETALTIIKTSAYLANYPFTAITADVAALMQRCLDRTSRYKANGPLLKIFEAYCDVTQVTITYLSLSTPAFDKIVRGFLGSLDGNSLITGKRSARVRHATNFVCMLNEMRSEVPLVPKFESQAKNPRLHVDAWEEARQNLDLKAVHYWNGWEVVSTKGVSSYLPIAFLWRSHGQEFAEEVFQNMRRYLEKTARLNIAEFNAFVKFLGQNPDQWPPSAFHHPIKIKNCFVQFMLVYFNNSAANGLDIPSRTRSYSKFIFSIEEAFLQGGVWAKPFGGSLPKPYTTDTPGAETNITNMNDGETIKEKLITQIPLQITDRSAIELLFRTINEDINLILAWAKSRVRDLRKRQITRNRLASTGTPIIASWPKSIRVAAMGEANFCATFNMYGLKYIRDNFATLFGEKAEKSKIAPFFVLPGRDDFYFFQFLLVHGHPCITESFFLNFELYNKSGQLSGILKTDTGHQLVGYKDRRKGDLSEQKIDLTPREAVLIRQIITLTAPLRSELKSAGDDNWRYLFLQCSHELNYPNINKPRKLTKNQTVETMEEIISQLSVHTKRSRSELKNFIHRVSLTTLRASCGVAIYLKTKSVEEMAKALGHSEYNSSLLSRYLPEPILAFFQTRWIRAFQRGIICEAMKDSPYLLQVASFQSMDELHEFLENHAIKEIPPHLLYPEKNRTNRVPAHSEPITAPYIERVLISIDVGILTALLSVQAAVSASPRRSEISALALYWSEFADLVAKEIDRGWDNELQLYLATARQHASADRMRTLIYAPTA